jgi:hypothetical protein
MKVHDKFGLILRIEFPVNDVSFFRSRTSRRRPRNQMGTRAENHLQPARAAGTAGGGQPPVSGVPIALIPASTSSRAMIRDCWKPSPAGSSTSAACRTGRYGLTLRRSPAARCPACSSASAPEVSQPLDRRLPGRRASAAGAMRRPGPAGRRVPQGYLPRLDRRFTCGPEPEQPRLGIASGR